MTLRYIGRLAALTLLGSLVLPAAAHADACIALTSYGNLTLNGTVDDAANFNSDTAGEAAGTCFVLPAGKILGVSSVPAKLTVANQQLQFAQGTKVKVLNSSTGLATLGAAFVFNADGTSTVNLEVDVNGGNQGSTAIDGARTLDNSSIAPKGVRLLGRTRIYDATEYGLRFNDDADVYVEDAYISNVTHDCVHAQNIAGTAAAIVTLKRVRCDRGSGSLLDPDNDHWPDVQVIGTGTYPTTLFGGDLDLAAPINSSSGSEEGMEVRYARGSVTKILTKDGSIGVSIASGTQDFTIGHIAVAAGPKWSSSGNPRGIGVEVASGDASVPTKNVAIGTIEVNGKNSSGTAVTPWAVVFDGAYAGHDVSIGTIRAGGFTDDGIGIFATATTSPSWTNVTVADADIDASSVTGAAFGHYYGVDLATPCSSCNGAVSEINFGTISVHGGGIARACVRLDSVSKISGTFACDGINTSYPLVALRDDATYLATMDNVNLTVVDKGSNPTSAQLSITLSNGGVLGNSVSVGSDHFTPYTANFTGRVFDVKNKLWNAYSVSNTAPESTLDGAIGSTVQFADGSAYWKSTAAGTLTGWLLRGATNGDPLTPPHTFGTIGTCNATNQGRRTFVTDATVSAFGATIGAGSGSNKVPAVCDGTNWVVGMLETGRLLMLR
jgi:hypothetical protein